MPALKFLGLSLILGVMLMTSGCAENPGTWPAEKVAPIVQESLQLTDIDIQERAEGGFEGSGTREDGETVDFTVTQAPDAGKISWDAKGDRGYVEEGSYQLQ